MHETGSSSQTGERLEIHNVSVDELVAEAHLCGQVHLPTGRTCVAYEGHTGSCQFENPEHAHEMARQERNRS
jgi:hypothetical protein